MDERHKSEKQMTIIQTEATKRILDRVASERLDSDAERSYRDFVKSINSAKDSDIERALLLR
ncbi:MAG: hypothetical protein EOS66_04105 [Mesorhizobium sp.]|uniref:hypothetical protein n=1 Tax=unclassified Mesorhizobium TaxID=325217 RepID=UPI000FCB5517|nr:MULTISPECIES: hypothetical protein [unclassified Mesorhizobium]RWF59942.1 MAG: hypothetical protein EOS66_04105 [Mesorhizobium sp.]RVC97438.1 hypothetical protein EN739_04480 [Mesorhizobium sp. M2A.F.Ca.ET.017.03.2.1]RVD10597.1 hypothetical protein EN753_05695 [Mesorhizobium sp. M2A.F.Ca.ET.029.05.1.1]TIW58900.1 MAG: hypothetical protein E5V54_01125 [Mesorhizobium sp.]TIW82433.1 MAG: hypothetical protein E5V53_08300 [Mesorhizobium sp.]